MNENFINLKGTKTHNMEIARRNKMLEYIKEETELEKFKGDINKIQEESLLESSLQNFIREKRDMNYLLNESYKIVEENSLSIMKESFAKVVLESLPIDKDSINANESEIREKATGFIEKLHENANIFIESFLLEEVNSISENIVLLKESTRIEGNILNESSSLFEEENINEDLCKLNEENVFMELTETIKGKVKKVIAEEKLFAEAIELNEKGETNVNLFNTTFKEIQFENVKLALEECKGLNKEDIMETAFYETVVDYTILEAANTMKLFETNDLFLKRNKKIHKNPKELF